VEKNEAEMKLGKLLGTPSSIISQSPHPSDHGLHQEEAKCGAEI